MNINLVLHYMVFAKKTPTHQNHTCAMYVDDTADGILIWSHMIIHMIMTRSEGKG